MSGYAALVPMARFSDKPRAAGGTVPGDFAQCQIASGNDGTSLGICEWLNGGVGGQIHMVIPELDLVIISGVVVRGTRDAAATPTTGVFDIQVRGNANIGAIGALTAESGTISAYPSVQRAITGTWSIDKEVTDLP